MPLIVLKTARGSWDAKQSSTAHFSSVCRLYKAREEARKTLSCRLSSSSLVSEEVAAQRTGSSVTTEKHVLIPSQYSGIT